MLNTTFFSWLPCQPLLVSITVQAVRCLVWADFISPPPLHPIPSLPGSSCIACWRISQAPWQQPELVIGSLSCEAFPFQMSILHLTIASLQASKTQVKPLLPQRAAFWGEARPNLSLCLLAHYFTLSSETQSLSFWVALLVYVCIFSRVTRHLWVDHFCFLDYILNLSCNFELQVNCINSKLYVKI